MMTLVGTIPYKSTRLILKLNRPMEFPRSKLTIEIVMEDGARFEISTDDFEVMR